LHIHYYLRRNFDFFFFGRNHIGKRQGERPEEMGLLTIIKKVKRKEKEMRILMVYEF
jgi:hypothetical protein